MRRRGRLLIPNNRSLPGPVDIPAAPFAQPMSVLHHRRWTPVGSFEPERATPLFPT
jgi:hypothetical protein